MCYVLLNQRFPKEEVRNIDLFLFFFLLIPIRKGATWNVFFVSGVGAGWWLRGGSFIRNMDLPATSFFRSYRGRLAFRLQLVSYPASRRGSGRTSIVFTRLTWWWQTGPCAPSSGTRWPRARTCFWFRPLWHHFNTVLQLALTLIWTIALIINRWAQ